MSAHPTHSSLDDLVSATLADFAACGVDCLTKLEILDAAWRQNSSDQTQETDCSALEAAASSETIHAQLEELTAAGFLIYTDGCYRLTENPSQCLTLRRLHSFWSDRELRSRAAPLLRYRLS